MKLLRCQKKKDSIAKSFEFNKQTLVKILSKQNKTKQKQMGKRRVVYCRDKTVYANIRSE